MKQRKCNCCKLKKSLENDFYWDSTNTRYETQCKKCRVLKQKITQRKTYNSANEHKRYLKRKANGEFEGAWRKWREKYPEKYKARQQLRNAVKAGKIEKGSCMANDGCKGRLEAHHDDYSKPLEVKWLCQKHHKEHHYGSLQNLTESINRKR